MRSKVFPILPTSGINKLQDPAAIGDNEAVEMRNLMFKQLGIMDTRNGMAFNEHVIQFADFDESTLQSRSHNDNSTLMQVTHSNFPSPINFCRLTEYSKSKWTALLKRPDNDNYTLEVFPPVRTSKNRIDRNYREFTSRGRPTFFKFNNEVHVLDGITPGYKLNPDSIFTVTNPAINPNPPPTWQMQEIETREWNDPIAMDINFGAITPRLATVVNGRTWYADLGKGRENWIVVSDYLQPTTIVRIERTLTEDGVATVRAISPYDIDGYAFAVGSYADGPITAIQEIVTNAQGTNVERAIAVWQKNKMFIIYGEPPQTQDLISFQSLQQLQVTNMTNAQGCIGQNAVFKTQYGIFWISQTSVWCMPVGSFPIDIGQKISPLIKGLSSNTYDKVFLCADKEYLYMGLPSPENDVNNADTPMEDIYLLDLRLGVGGQSPIIWYGPQSYIPYNSDSDSGRLTRGVFNLQYDELLQCVTSMQFYCIGHYNRINKWVDSSVFPPSNRVTLPATDEMPYDYIYGLSIVDYQNSLPRDISCPDEINLWLEGSYNTTDFIRVPSDYSDKLLIPATGSGVVSGSYNTGSSLPVFNPKSITNGDNPSELCSNPSPDGSITWQSYYDTLNVLSDGMSIPWYYTVSRSKMVDNEVLPKLITKEYLFGDGVISKLWNGHEFGFWSNRDSIFRHSVLTDFETDTRDLRIDSNFDLDSGSMENQLAIRKWTTRKIVPAYGKRSIAKSLQFIFEQTPKIVIPDGEITIIQYNNISHSISNQITVPIIGGEYDDMSQVLTMFKIAFNAAMSAFTPDIVLSIYNYDFPSDAQSVHYPYPGLKFVISSDYAPYVNFFDYFIKQDTAFAKYFCSLLGLITDATYGGILWQHRTGLPIIDYGNPTFWKTANIQAAWNTINTLVTTFKRRAV